MASESNGKKPESTESAPPSGHGRRTSGRAPSQWGAVRDALSAIFNLEALLRNATVPMKTIADVLPEIHASGALLREAFEVRTTSDAATIEAGAHGRQRLADLDGILAAIASGETDRAALAVRLSPAADEIEASSELLALIDRAGKGSVTEVGLDLVAREAGRLSTASRGRVLRVRFGHRGRRRAAHARDAGNGLGPAHRDGGAHGRRALRGDRRARGPPGRRPLAPAVRRVTRG